MEWGDKMAIDNVARQRLINDRSQAQLNNGLDNIVQAVKNSDQSRPIIESLINQISQLNNQLGNEMRDKVSILTDAFKKNELTTDQVQQFKELIDSVNSKLEALDSIKKQIEDYQGLKFPENQTVSGEVSVSEIKKLPPVEISNLQEFPDIVIPKPLPFPKTMDIGTVGNLPPVKVSNFSDMQGLFNSLQTSLANLVLALPKPDASKKVVPMEVKEWDTLIQGIEDVRSELVNGFNILIKNSQEAKGSTSDKPMAVEIVKDLPRPMANPVTNVSLNGLGGFLQTTQVTVTAALTVLPPSPLSSRRGVMIYNNSNQTVELGGSTFTFGNGIPVPAGTYGPPIDASSKLIVYGRVASGSADVRVAETSDIATGR